VSKSIYLDHNATTPPDARLAPLCREWIEQWGNPSSIHWAGRGPKAVLRHARQAIAKMVGADPLEIVLTSGGSEANNAAIKGLCQPLISSPSRSLRDQVIVSAVEHPSVRKAAEALVPWGYRVEVIPVSRDGVLNLQVLAEKLSERTALVAVMLANNETGHIFPVSQVVEMAHKVGARVHCDAVQGLGKMNLQLHALGVDTAAISGHKFYAFKGAGALYVRRGVNMTSLIHGGGQERGRRAGTENLLSVASLGYMCEWHADVEVQSGRLCELRNHMEQRILAEIPDVEVTGAGGARLPNTSSMVLARVDGETLLMNLDVRGYAVSTGAACSSGNPEPSPVLLSMGLSRAEAQSSLRVSLGWSTTREEVDLFVDELKSVVVRLRNIIPREQVAYGL